MADTKNGGNLAPSQPTTYPRYREGYGAAFNAKKRFFDFSKSVAKCLLLFAKCSSLRNTCHVLKNAFDCVSKFEKCFTVCNTVEKCLSCSTRGLVACLKTFKMLNDNTLSTLKGV